MQVYLIRQQNTNFYKIGVSKNPTTRLNQLQTACPETLELIHTFKTNYGFQLENYVHRKYANTNYQLEWFELTEKDVKQFIDICTQGERNFNLLEEQNTYIQDKANKKALRK